MQKAIKNPWGYKTKERVCSYEHMFEMRDRNIKKDGKKGRLEVQRKK